jgi:hypothetical protein
VLRWVFRVLDKNMRMLRFVLAMTAVVLLVLGWLVAPHLHKTDWAWVVKNQQNFQRLAAVPAVLFGFFEALRSILEHKASQRANDTQEQFDEILVELEDACATAELPSRTYHCGITVWQLQKRTWRERWQHEKRPRLKSVAIRPVRYKRRTSGLRWRLGMGVIGMALADNTRLAVDVDEAWRPLRDCGPEKWQSQPREVVQGLSYTEFQTAVAGAAGTSESAGQFVLAVPIWKGDKPIGVVALDTPPRMGPAALDSRVSDLLYAVGTYVLVD